MLTISNKSRYGLHALLSLAGHYGRGLLQIKDIARRNSIPPQFLGQIFNQLVKADIISSTRGKGGGYQLSRPPSEISVLEILEVLEGGLDLAGDGPNDVVQELFRQAEEALRKLLDLSLAELLDRQKKKAQVLMFDI